MTTLAAVQTSLDRPVPPLHSFPTAEVYVWRLEQGTLIEMANETELLKRSNEKRTAFKAWVVAPIPGMTTSFTTSWILLVRPPPHGSDGTAFPGLTDRFSIDMQTTIERPNGKFSLMHLQSTRIQNPYENVEGLPNAFAQKCAAFKVDVPRSWQDDDGVNIDMDLMKEFQTASSLDDFKSLTLPEAAHQAVVIIWDTFSLTYEAELAALRLLVEDKRIEERQVSRKAQLAFKMIRNFNECWRSHYDLHEEFPHLKDPCHRHHRLPPLLLERFQSFNKDHLAAYNGLKAIPNGLYFVNGCPGAGKTEWNMIVAALIQAKPRPRPRPKRSPILFLVDLNKTVDDAADRYYNLCKAAGLKLRIVRMYGWPYEMRNSSRINKESTNSNNGQGELDFTKKFLTTVNLARHANVERNPHKAPTLDEEAWGYYEKHKTGCFDLLKRVLGRMDTGEALCTED